MATNNILTISIGSMSIKLCEVSYSGNSIHLHKAAVIKTPVGSVEDGFIKDEQSVVDVIRTSMEINKFEAKTAVFSIFSSRIASREVMLPDIKEKKMSQVIAANASEYFPVNIEEYIISHKSLETVVEDKQKQQRVLVLAAPKEIVMSCFSIGLQLGLYVDRVDYAGNSAVQVAKREIGSETSLIIHIQEDNSTINIMKNNILQIQRIVPYGKSLVVQALAEEKGIDEYEAEEMLGTEELIHEHFDNDAVTDSLRYLVNNVVRVVDYYVSRNPGEQVEKAYLTGAAAELQGIDKLFANEFDFPSTELLEMKDVVVAGDLMIEQNILPRFIVNLGAGISPADFIPDEEIEKVNKEVNFKIMNLALLGSVLIALIIVMIPLVQYLTVKGQRDSMQENVNKISEVEQIINDYYVAKDKYTDVQNFYAMTENADDSLQVFLEDLEKNMPSDISIKSLSIASGAVGIEGVAASKESVAKFMLQLENFGYVNNVVAGAMSEKKDTSGLITESFSITCTFTKVTDTTED
ncbi:MAG: pilus assembly protein PilM [Lachnospiraceae bacterium]|nr:pilus assembly protein PilM [Lachnospiraceae bacterium]